MTVEIVRGVLPTLAVGDPLRHENLTLVPLFGGEGRYRDYLLASEAIDAGALTVTEVGDDGMVPELLAANQGERPVLLIDGEELQGAKQNRILNTSILLAPRSRTRVPVSCVEQGRWSHVSREFKAGSYAPSKLRGRKSRDVQRSLKMRGCAMSDQGAVWDSVEEQLVRACPTSKTRAMADAVKERSYSTRRYEEALLYPARCCGLVAAIDGAFVAVDLFDAPATLQVVWSRLVSSYALEAVTARSEIALAYEGSAATKLVSRLAELEWSVHPSVGLGADLRFEAPGLVAQALRVDESLLHLSAFPAVEGDERGTYRTGRIRRTSWRRRRRPE